jgi:hypothetical protein
MGTSRRQLLADFDHCADADADNGVELSLSTSGNAAGSSQRREDADNTEANADAQPTSDQRRDTASPSSRRAKAARLSEASWRSLAAGDEHAIKVLPSSDLVKAQRALEASRLCIIRERKKRQFWARMRSRASSGGSLSSPAFNDASGDTSPSASATGSTQRRSSISSASGVR